MTQQEDDSVGCIGGVLVAIILYVMLESIINRGGGDDNGGEGMTGR